jgi:hypothetical protein
VERPLADVVGRTLTGAQLGGELGRPDVVVGDPVDDVVELGVLVRLHPRRDARVGPGAVALRQRAVRDLAHHVGPERPLLRRARAAEEQQLLGVERLEHRPHVLQPEVLPGHDLDGGDGAATPEDRAVVEDAALLGGEAVEARGHEPPQRVGQLGGGGAASHHAGLAEEGDELLEEEGVATAPIEEGGGQARVELVAGQLREQLG